MKQNIYLPEGCLINNPANRLATANTESLERAFIDGAILEGICSLCDGERNLHVRLGRYKGIIPHSECVYLREGERPKDIAIISRVGKPVCFKIIEIQRNGDEPTLILSRRLAQLEATFAYIDRLLPGDIIPAKVTHLESFGAFADVGCGIVSLLPIDTLSVSRIAHPKDRLYTGQDIKVVVKAIDRESGRISLSHRELLGTWQENAQLYCAGQTAAGIIRSIGNYGVFVELTPNLAGLAEYREGAEVGKSAAVYIKSIIKDKMKVKLVIIDTYPSEGQPLPMNYFIKQGHIDYWRYSPAECDKLVESRFA